MNRWGIPAWLEEEVRQRDKCCIYCGVKMLEKMPKGGSRRSVATWEHIINDARIITRENIARCCFACNSSKGTKKLSDWMNSTYCKKHRINEDTVAEIVKQALKAEHEEKKPARTFRVSLNPLVFYNIDEAFPEIHRNDSPEGLLENLCSPGIESKLETFKTRYREITDAETVKLNIAPADEPKILEKMIWPLKCAKASYILGNLTGTIALCGMVAEMVAILTFELSEAKLNNLPISENNQKKLFGSTFEKLGQDKRIKVLEAFGAIGSELKQQFENIRKIRKKYLHFWSNEQNEIEDDAKLVYGAAVHLVSKTLGVEIVDSQNIKMNPAFVRYLENKGLLSRRS